MPRSPILAAGLMTVACLLAIVVAAWPGVAVPIHPAQDETPTPSAVIYLPWIAGDFVVLPTFTPTATATSTPTATPTPTPTLPPPCPLPDQIASDILLTVTPNRNTGLEQLVGKVPLTVQMSVAVSGGTPPYTYCWDLEPDGHRDATLANPTFTLTRPGIADPFVVVIDAQGNGQYVGAPPVASSLRRGGERP